MLSSKTKTKQAEPKVSTDNTTNTRANKQHSRAHPDPRWVLCGEPSQPSLLGCEVTSTFLSGAAACRGAGLCVRRTALLRCVCAASISVALVTSPGGEGASAALTGCPPCACSSVTLLFEPVCPCFFLLVTLKSQL